MSNAAAIQEAGKKRGCQVGSDVRWTIDTAALEAMAAHARAESPRECCGLLMGIAGHVVEAKRAPNLSDDPNGFLLDPQAHVEALREGRRRALEVVGFYHSHPHSQPVPSPRDLADALYPDHLHAIVSLRGDDVETRVYRVRTDGYEEVRIEAVTPPAFG